MSKITLDNTQIFSDFDNHISLVGNYRILFSAPFGTGKSTYLTDYFEHNKEEYFCLNLYPVNYSVSQNEDIFELIKFDLLLQLMGNFRDQIDLKNEDFSNVLSFQALFLKELKITPILLGLLEESGKIGKSAKILIDEVKNQYHEFKKQFENEELFIENYLQNIENKIGNVNEMDAYSSIIFKLLARVKEKFPEKKSVLIIDDLDRLDPEHIFRLFNIFSVNFGKEEILNKFGFDKIIFVCDIENIKNIYKHRYGIHVDFSGYIDKFFSYFPFEFDNRTINKLRLEDILNSYSENDRKYFEFKESGYYQEFVVLKSLLLLFIENKIINLRMLLDLNELNIPVQQINYSGYLSSNRRFRLIPMIFVLKNIFGSFSALRESVSALNTRIDLQKLTSNHQIKYKDDRGLANEAVVNLCIPFLVNFDSVGKPTNIKESQSFEKTLYLESFNCYIHFKEEYNHNLENEYFRVQKVTTNEDKSSEEVKLLPLKILEYTINKCFIEGYI